MDTRIQAIGIAQSYCWESPKPLEFGTAGQNWEDIGWKVKVVFTALATKIRPKDHIEILRPLLPEPIPTTDDVDRGVSDPDPYEHDRDREDRIEVANLNEVPRGEEHHIFRDGYSYAAGEKYEE